MSSRNFKLRLDCFYYDTVFSSVNTFRPRRRMCVLQIGYLVSLQKLSNMKKLLFILCLAALFTACNTEKKTQAEFDRRTIS